MFLGFFNLSARKTSRYCWRCGFWDKVNQSGPAMLIYICRAEWEEATSVISGREDLWLQSDTWGWWKESWSGTTQTYYSSLLCHMRCILPSDKRLRCKQAIIAASAAQVWKNNRDALNAATVARCEQTPYFMTARYRWQEWWGKTRNGKKTCTA